jgi:hypothetical protein
MTRVLAHNAVAAFEQNLNDISRWPHDAASSRREHECMTRERMESPGHEDRALVLEHLDRRRWCTSCNRQMVPLTIDDVVVVTGEKRRTVERWVEHGVVHFRIESSGAVLICPDSLPTMRWKPSRSR